MGGHPHDLAKRAASNDDTTITCVMIRVMLKICQTPALLDPNAGGGSPCINAEFALSFADDVTVEANTPQVLEPGTAYKFIPASLGLWQNFWDGTLLNVPGYKPVAQTPAPLLIGQQGDLQEYRGVAVAASRLLKHQLQWLNSADSWLISTAEPAAVEPGIDVRSPSLQGPYWPSQYFESVQQELVSLICEIQVELRKTLTDLDRLLGCIDHILLVIRRFISSNIRLFCSVRWEQRRWFLFHGARPPKTVQWVLDFFIGVCSGSSLAT